MEREIRRCICTWYGVPRMPVWILSLDDEIVEFQSQHPEIPADWWSVVNHASRQVLLWAKQTHDCFDFVVWDGQDARMIQDLCFKDAYETTADWYVAIQQILQDKSRTVLIVRHT